MQPDLIYKPVSTEKSLFSCVEEQCGSWPHQIARDPALQSSLFPAKQNLCLRWDKLQPAVPRESFPANNALEVSSRSWAGST